MAAKIKIGLIPPLVILSVLAACESEDKNKKTSKQDFIPTEKLYKIDKVLNEARVHCSPQSNCPEQVGYVLSSTVKSSGESGISQCTGTLISPDIVMTNSHCIPTEVKQDPNLCRDRLGIMFPAHGSRALAKAACTEFISASNLEPNKKFLPDYAFFKIKLETPRNHFTAAREGIHHDQTLKLYAVNPTSKYQAIGRLEEKECIIKHGTFVNGKANHKFSPVLIGFEEAPGRCTIVGGNSGSAALNSNQQIVGIVQSIIEDAANTGIVDSLKPLDSAAGFKIRSLNHLLDPWIFSNVACMKFPAAINISNPNSSCTFGTIDGLISHEAFYSEFKSALEEKIQPILSKEVDNPIREFKTYKIEPYLSIQDETDFIAHIFREACVIPELWNRLRRRQDYVREYRLLSYRVFLEVNKFWKIKGKAEDLLSYHGFTVELKVPAKLPILTYEDQEVGDLLITSLNREHPWHNLTAPANLRLCTDEELEAPLPTTIDFESLKKQLEGE